MTSFYATLNQNVVSYAGGGWTLVVSVSSSNRDHLIQRQHNCFNSTICVPHEDGVNIPSRKMKDEDIQMIASSYDGIRINPLA